MATRDELVVVLRERYALSARAEQGRILDEFSAVTGFHRKHAMRLLGGGQTNQQRGPRPRRRIYDDAVREALIVVWEASDIPRFKSTEMRSNYRQMDFGYAIFDHLPLLQVFRIENGTSRPYGRRDDQAIID